ncbi:MAG: zinc ribbon domain-containing protein [Blastocatellia bacterium]
MSEQQVFQVPNLKLDQLAYAIGDWYRSQRFDVQVLPVPGEGMVVQAKQQESWRNALGMSSTLNIGLRYTQSTLIVEIGAGKWADKALAGGVGVLLVWPLFFTAAYGAWKQSNLPRQTFEFIQAFIGGTAAQNPYQNPYQSPYQNPYQSPPSTPPPPRPDSAPTQQTARRFCENCGGALSPSAKFCAGCGSKVS